MTKIGIGLSGGVDSAVAAWKLREAGYDVIGYTMQVVPGSSIDAEAARIAEFLGIPLRFLDLTVPFEEKILAPFVDSYATGFTPSPCVWCNRHLKFGLLASAVLNDGCDCFATGHYAQIDHLPDGSLRLLRGKDPVKDQSYFLAQVPVDIFQKVVFPLGGMLKSEVRALAEKIGIPSADRPESQDLCFLSNETFADFILRRRPELQRPGWIVSTDGKRLGRHNGAFQYTYGQRRGLGLGGGPWFVSRVDIPENRVVVAHGSEMNFTECALHEMRYGASGCETDAVSLEGMAQVRYRMTPRAARLIPAENQMARLVFNEPVQSITPGQLAVIYDGDAVAASGWIK